MYAFCGSKTPVLVGDGPTNKAGKKQGIPVSPSRVLQIPTINVVEQLLEALRARECLGDPSVEAAIFYFRHVSSKAFTLTNREQYQTCPSR